MSDDGSRVREIRWVASAKDDLSELPADVKSECGQALWDAQCGLTPVRSKPMHGRLRDVREIFIDENGNAYRTVYTTTLGDYVYVLDAFKKKSKKGSATPQRDLDRIERRLRAAREHYEQNP